VEGLKLLALNNIEIFIVTNQSGIARGYYSETDYKKLTTYMIDALQKQGIDIKEVICCPHHPEGTVKQYRMVCDCRKPSSGMIKRIMSKHGLAKGEVALIGDKNSDVEAGKGLVIRTYLIESDYTKEEGNSPCADFLVKDLKSAILHLLESVGKRKIVNSTY